MFPLNSLDVRRKKVVERTCNFVIGSKSGMLCCILTFCHKKVKMKPSRALASGVLGKGFVLTFVLLLMNHTPGERPKKYSTKVLNFLRSSVKTPNIQLIYVKYLFSGR